MNTNVKLSENEMLLACNADFILTKNAVISKAVDLFGEVSTQYQKQVSHYSALPEDVFKISAKIYRGEKYKMLPYVLLDYPRFFDKKNIFAVRSFFWWGNFFSITLILKGKFFRDYLFEILEQKDNQWLFYTGNDVWSNDFNADEFLLQKNVSAEMCLNQNFLKIAKKIPLEKWNESIYFFEKNFIELLSFFPFN